MITKEDFLKLSITNFTRFGSHNYTMDQLAAELGISKKTIYQHFKNKQELVFASFQYLLERFKQELNDIEEREKDTPLRCIVSFYRMGMGKLQAFNPAFLHGLQKYYPETYTCYQVFKQNTIFGKVLPLLKSAQQQGILRKDVNPELFCKLHLFRMENVLFSGNLLNEYDRETLLEHFITNNLRGLMTGNYIRKHGFSL